MNNENLLQLIDNAMIDIVEFSRIYGNTSNDLLNDTKKVLLLLRQESEEKNDTFNERILRAMHDIGGSSVKNFENSNLEESISKIVEHLYIEIPSYKWLKPLRLDFGGGTPI